MFLGQIFTLYNVVEFAILACEVQIFFGGQTCNTHIWVTKYVLFNRADPPISTFTMNNNDNDNDNNVEEK